MPDRTPCWPGLVSSLHFESSERRALFRKRSVPSRRASLHLGPVYRATFGVLLSQKFSVDRAIPADRVIHLYAAPFWGPAAVVRNRRHVRNARDLDAERVQRAHGRFAPGAGALDANFEVLHAALHR